MQEFIRHFERGPDGAWTCLSSAEIHNAHGRIQITEGSRFVPGTIFMGVDIVKLLDEENGRINGR